MRIIPKLTLALFAGTCLVLGVNGVLRVRREVGFLEAERVREHDRTGRSLAAAVTAVWRTEGRSAALASLEESRGRLSPMRLEWAEGAQVPPQIDAATLNAVRAGEPVTRVVRTRTDTTWYTFVPVDAGGVRRGVIELVETTSAEERATGAVLADTVKTAVALALLSALVSYAMSQWLLGRPVRVLVDKARRIGRGEFGGSVLLDRRDELAELAVEMNAMGTRLESTLEQLRHADRLATVGKLASGIAHELGTPLNVISARASMIADGAADSDECREYARVIVEASDRMTKIIRQLLQFARRRGVERRSTDLRRLAQETVDLLKPLARKREVSLKVEASIDDAVALVDAAQVQQVVTNLVVNAMQAAPADGQVGVRIEGCLAHPLGEVERARVDCIRLSIHDDGPGISPEDLPRIFEPFFTTKDVGEGTGLGLAVAYGIVRDHMGFIEVESRPGSGATFTVLLPRGEVS